MNYSTRVWLEQVPTESTYETQMSIGLGIAETYKPAIAVVLPCYQYGAWMNRWYHESL
jgi:hypothetical protein